MEALFRAVSGTGAGALAGVAALFAPAAPLATCATAAIFVDFVTGCLASRAVARRAGRRWRFESRKAWRTVRKWALVVTGIVMAWTVEYAAGEATGIPMARLFTGFVCGVELWSFLENAAQLSEAPLFRRLKRFLADRIGKEAADE